MKNLGLPVKDGRYNTLIYICSLIKAYKIKHKFKFILLLKHELPRAKRTLEKTQNYKNQPTNQKPLKKHKSKWIGGIWLSRPNKPSPKLAAR